VAVLDAAMNYFLRAFGL